MRLLPIFLLIPIGIFSTPVVIQVDSLPPTVVEATGDETVSDLEAYVRAAHEAGEEMNTVQLTPAGYNRDYHRPATEQEKADIYYIITTLADKPTATLLCYKSELTAAGDRIRPMHPLQFLYEVFSHEVLKTKISNIRGKSWVWGDFVAGFGSSVDDELSKNNLTREFIDDFAEKVGVDPAILYKPIESRHHEKILIVLIENVKRNDGHDHYDF